jgi:hypothetical protein
MTRLIFSEQQRFRQTVWIWLIILPVTIGTSLLMMYGFYQQIIVGEPWGNKPMSNGALIAVTTGVVLTEMLVIWLVLSMRIDIEITGREFRYKFFPYFLAWKTINATEIESYDVKNYALWDGTGLGYRKDPWSKTVRMIVQASYVITLKVKDGRTIIMSTKNKEELERAMRRLMSNSENI